MKAFVAVPALLAAALADQSAHQTVQLGHGPVVSHAVHKHHAGPALVTRPLVAAHPAPVAAHPAPVVVAHPAPAVAPYHPQPAYDEPAVYKYGYAVADDYS